MQVEERGEGEDWKIVDIQKTLASLRAPPVRMKPCHSPINVEAVAVRKT